MEGVQAGGASGWGEASKVWQVALASDSSLLPQGRDGLGRGSSVTARRGVCVHVCQARRPRRQPQKLCAEGTRELT